MNVFIIHHGYLYSGALTFSYIYRTIDQMMLRTSSYVPIIFMLMLPLQSCHAQPVSNEEKAVKTGAEQTLLYLPKLDEKRIALFVNQTSIIASVHLADTLLSLGVNIKKIFAPEHGFRGDAGAGEVVQNSVDAKTGIPIISMYGNHRKPSAEDLAGIDLLVFDIQDVGVRFYTYISSMSYAMEACARNDIPMLILDRPNPNGHYIDGPVMEPNCISFIGLHAGVPLVYGMTMAEYARMLNGEHWLPDSLHCTLSWVACQNYRHSTRYSLPVKPSPNLPNMRSVYLYPSLGLFEGTVISTGRGTDKQFQLLGHPDLLDYPYSFTPEPKPGAPNPKFSGVRCHGLDLSRLDADSLYEVAKINLALIRKLYRDFPDKESFFTSYFYKLAGNYKLQGQIEEGLTAEEIRLSWQEGLKTFRQIREKYLLYPE